MTTLSEFDCRRLINHSECLCVCVCCCFFVVVFFGGRGAATVGPHKTTTTTTTKDAQAKRVKTEAS